MWWSVTPKLPFAPWLVVALMGHAVDRDFPPLIARMAAAARGEPLHETAPVKLGVQYC